MPLNSTFFFANYSRNGLPHPKLWQLISPDPLFNKMMQ